MALLTAMNLPNRTQVKVHLKNLQRVLNDSQIKLRFYARKDFERFILSCLSPELVHEDLSQAERIQESYSSRAANLQSMHLIK